jgi:hypothetical protein
MNIKLKCPCGARFLASDQARGHAVRCPTCGKSLVVPEAAAVVVSPSAGDPEPVRFVTTDATEATPQAAAPRNRPAVQPTSLKPAAQPTSFTPAVAEPDTLWQARAVRTTAERSGGGWFKWVLLALVLLTPIAVVATLVLLPHLLPKDPRELVAQRYLDAVRREDFAEANRLSVLTTHPRLTHVERIGREVREVPPVAGKFQTLTEFHTGILQRYRFNPEKGRFELRDAFSGGMEVLSQLEQAEQRIREKEAADAADPARRKKSPDELMLDDVISRYAAIGELAKGAGSLLSSKGLGPTYKDLLDKTDLPLSDAERSLAAHYAADPAKWDRLLGRPFWELPGGGDFQLHEVQIQSTIRTEGQSFGEPGRQITLRLVRFTMGTIDTGWRVWQAE